MKRKAKLSLLVLVTVLALVVTAATVFGYSNYARSNQNAACTTCHLTTKATDLKGIPYVKPVNYAIAKGVFTLSRGKFYPTKAITNAEFKAAVEKAMNNTTTVVPNNSSKFTRAKLAEYIATIKGVNVSSESLANIADAYGNKYVAWAVNNGILPVTKKTADGKVFANANAYATRADAAYAITMAGLIQVVKNDKTFTPQSNVQHRDVTAEFSTWLTDANVTDHRIANFCMMSGCHDSDHDSNNDGVYDYDSILRIVYSTHYLMRTVTDLGSVSSYAYDNHTVEPGMFNRV